MIDVPHHEIRAQAGRGADTSSRGADPPGRGNEHSGEAPEFIEQTAGGQCWLGRSERMKEMVQGRSVPFNVSRCW